LRLTTLTFVAYTLAIPFLQAQSVGDPLSGKWSGNWGPTPSHRHIVVLELKWDGKTLKGTINPGPNAYRLQKTSFDPNTGAIHLEVDAGSMGHRLHYFIDAKVEDGLLFGTWHHTKLQGDFRLTKK
jgi:hypothetical protein